MRGKEHLFGIKELQFGDHRQAETQIVPQLQDKARDLMRKEKEYFHEKKIFYWFCKAELLFNYV